MSESEGFSAAVAVGFSLLFIITTTQIAGLIGGRDSLPPLAAKFVQRGMRAPEEGNDLAPAVLWLLVVGVAAGLVVWTATSPGFSPTERLLLWVPLVVGAGWSIWLAGVVKR